MHGRVSIDLRQGEAIHETAFEDLIRTAVKLNSEAQE